MSDKFILLLTLERVVSPNQSEVLETIELGAPFASEAEAREELELFLDDNDLDAEEE